MTRSPVSHDTLVLSMWMTSQHCSPAAAALLQQDVVALIDGNHPSDRACILSMFTQIPLLRHHGNHGDWDECKDMGVSLSASPDSYAYATVGLLETFHWVEVTILYEGKGVLRACVCVYNVCVCMRAYVCVCVVFTISINYIWYQG